MVEDFVKAPDWSAVDRLGNALLEADDHREAAAVLSRLAYQSVFAVERRDVAELVAGREALRRLHVRLAARAGFGYEQDIRYFLGRVIDLIAILAAAEHRSAQADFTKWLQDERFRPILDHLYDQDALQSKDLAERLGRDKTTLSKQLAVLAEAGLVVSQRVGKPLYTSLSLPGRRALAAAVEARASVKTKTPVEAERQPPPRRTSALTSGGPGTTGRNLFLCVLSRHPATSATR